MSENESAPELGAFLTQLRSDADKTQGEVAKAISFSTSRISRIENGASASEAEINSILDAIGTEEAARFKEYLSWEWRHVEAPAYDHPNLEALRIAEQALTHLDEIRAGGVSSRVEARLDLLRDELVRHAQHLLSLDYKLAFIGRIGVGKSTAISVLTELMLGEGIKDADVVLETGRGRTTICDVAIERGNRIGIIVEPFSSDEVFELARDLCEGVWAGEEAEDSSHGKGVTQETERALRCMANLQRKRRPKARPGEPRPPTPPDPLKSLAQESEDFDAFTAEVCHRMDLPKRNVRELWAPDGDELDQLKWLATTFRRVNNGRHPQLSLPKLIRVILPRSPIPSDQYSLSVIDTKGVDGTAIRTDLHEHRDDERTLMMICSGFEEAPSAEGLAFMESSVAEAAQHHLLERGQLVVLARDGQAEELKDDTGEQVLDVEDGYALRGEQVGTELQKLGLEELPIQFLDASRDEDVDAFIDAVHARIERMRTAKATAIEELRETVRETTENIDKEEAEAAHARVRQDLLIFLKRHHALPKRERPPQRRLLEDVSTAHPRTVWATTRRRGTWWNLHAPNSIGTGARIDASARSQKALIGISEVLDNLRANDELEPAWSFIDTLKGTVEGWREDFLNEARQVGVTVFRLPLTVDVKFWRACEKRYGWGGGFRDAVVNDLAHWFDNRDKLLTQYDTKLQQVWEEEFIDPLAELVAEGPGEE